MPPTTADRSVVAVGLAALVAGAAAAITLWGAAVSLHLRPLDGVEGDLLFEASRIRDGLRLYVDPLEGARDYGAIPARYYVLYPPLWAGFLSLWPASIAASAGRVTSIVAWWGVLAWLAATARLACRVPALLAAAFVGGVYAMAEFGASARPDAVALALAGVALAGCMRRGEGSALAGALFALAAWTKPNVVGMGLGTLLACAFLAPRSLVRAALGAGAVSVVAAGVLEVASSGTWLTHLVAGTAQPLHLRLVAHHLAARGQFFLAFLALAAFVAFRGRASSPRAPAILTASALGASVAWSLVAFAKTGSAANYWMEPCLAAVVVFARVPLPALTSRLRLALAVAVPLQALWTGVGSVRATFEWVEMNRLRAALLARARALCGAAPEALVVADEPGIEMALDGRLVAHPFPLAHQALAGRLSLAPWIADLARPEIACLVTAHDRVERPPSEVDVDYDYFTREVRAALSARFEPVAASAGWEVYAPRDRGRHER